MHRFQSQSTVTRFKVGASLILLKCLLIPAVVGILAYALIENERPLTLEALAACGGVLLLAAIQWVIVQRTRCPLCMTPVMAGKACSKHRRARTVLGSYRLRVALAVIFRGSFVCPYCNEPSAMEVRNSQRRSQRRKV